LLGAIGLDEVQESAYRTLVGLGAAELPDLAHRLGLSEDEAGRILRRLEQHGLVARSSARPGRWVAAPPGVALSALLTRQRHELDQAELAAAVLAAEFRAEATEPAVHDLVEVVTGANAVAQRFLQLQFGAESEVCALVTDKPVAISGMENEAEEDAAARGVAYRVVVERDVVTMPHGLAELSAALGRDERVRVVDRVPTKLVVADRTLAMVPLTTRDRARPAGHRRPADPVAAAGRSDRRRGRQAARPGPAYGAAPCQAADGDRPGHHPAAAGLAVLRARLGGTRAPSVGPSPYRPPDVPGGTTRRPRAALSPRPARPVRASVV
jgi:sugar-specific transcriptional regulator TrmB